MKTNNLKKNSEQEIINDYQKIVQFVIKNMNLKYRIDELYDIGMIGFVNGINTYDSSKGVKCITYLCECIKNQILQYLQHEKMKKRDAKLISLNETINNTELGDMIPTYYDYDRNLYLEEIFYSINRRLSWLNERDELIFKYLYGIDGFKQLSVSEIEKKFKTSKQNIQRIKTKILKMLKYEIKDYYKTYLDLINENNH